MKNKALSNDMQLNSSIVEITCFSGCATGRDFSTTDVLCYCSNVKQDSDVIVSWYVGMLWLPPTPPLTPGAVYLILK